MSSKHDRQAKAHLPGRSSNPSHLCNTRNSHLRPGSFVEVFSRSAGCWFPASVAHYCDVTCHVLVEFQVNGTPAKKTLHVDSEHLRLLPNAINAVSQNLTLHDHHSASSSGKSGDESEGAEQEYDPAACFPWPSFFHRAKCLKAGEHILGAAVVSTPAETGYVDVDNPGQFWTRTGSQTVPVANRKWWYSHSVGDSTIRMTKDVDVDEDFGGRDSTLRITSDDNRELLRTSSCGLKGDVESMKLEAILEARLGHEVCEGKGSLAFEFTVPCLHLKLKQKGRFRNDPHVAEVILGCQASGEIKASGARKDSAKLGLDTSFDFTSIGVNLVGSHDTSRGAGGYNLNYTVNGGPQLSIGQQTRTMTEIIHYLETEWQQKAAAAPETWKVLWVKIRGIRPSSISSRDHLVLIYGEVGVGKSTLINELVGGKVAKEGLAHRGVTKEIQEYQTQYDNVSITLVDVPGVGDKDRIVADVLDELWTLYEASRFSALVILVNGSDPRFNLAAQLIPRLFRISFRDTANRWGESTLLVGTKFDRIPKESHEEYLVQVRNIAAEISTIAGTEPIPEGQIIAKSKGDDAQDFFQCLLQILGDDMDIPIAKADEAELYEAYLSVHGIENVSDTEAAAQARERFENEWQEPRRQTRLKLMHNYIQDGRLEELKRCLEDVDELFHIGKKVQDQDQEQLRQIEAARKQAREWEGSLQQAMTQLQTMIDTHQFSSLAEVRQAAAGPPFSKHEQFQQKLSHAIDVNSLLSKLNFVASQVEYLAWQV